MKIETGRPPFVASDRGRALAKEGQAIYAEIERTLDIVEMTGGATDAGFANRSGKAIVVESFGLAGFGYHARDEYIDTDSIVPRLYLMTRMRGFDAAVRRIPPLFRRRAHHFRHVGSPTTDALLIGSLGIGSVGEGFAWTCSEGVGDMRSGSGQRQPRLLHRSCEPQSDRSRWADV